MLPPCSLRLVLPVPPRSLYRMTDEGALVRVTQLYWLIGAGAFLHAFLSVLQEGRLPLNLGLFSVWIAVTLRARRPRAWQAARIYSSVLILFLGAVAVPVGAGWLPPAILGLRLVDGQVVDMSRLGTVALLASLMAICGWQLFMLQRADVRRLFPVDPRSGASDHMSARRGA
jgi:hypothetical protein